eukprot:TRINITY_DN10001_c0_g1_i1.p1 TRINITY_DN10001_c0_g1~~TRINITY_DN10001_c0_g1_i1.p1  ORF type:complete len:294 (-),score=57.53 TRINITY_DN10001_c0_g1_i1:368-1249(-)
MGKWVRREYRISSELLEEYKKKRKTPKTYALIRGEQAEVSPKLRNVIEIQVKESKNLLLRADHPYIQAEFISAYNTAREVCLALNKPFDFDNLSDHHSAALEEFVTEIPDATDIYLPMMTMNSMLCFLRSSDFRVHDAVDVFRRVMSMRRRYPEMNCLKVNDVWNVMESEFMYTIPDHTDLLGHPLLFIDYSKQQSLQSHWILVWAYAMDRAEEMCVNLKVEKVTIVMNLANFQVKTADRTFMKRWNTMMNCFYPHRNRPIVYVINAPRIVSGTLGAFKKFLNPDLFQSIQVL